MPVMWTAPSWAPLRPQLTSVPLGRRPRTLPARFCSKAACGSQWVRQGLLSCLSSTEDKLIVCQLSSLLKQRKPSPQTLSVQLPPMGLQGRREGTLLSSAHHTAQAVQDLAARPLLPQPPPGAGSAFSAGQGHPAPSPGPPSLALQECPALPLCLQGQPHFTTPGKTPGGPCPHPGHQDRPPPRTHRCFWDLKHSQVLRKSTAVPPGLSARARAWTRPVLPGQRAHCLTAARRTSWPHQEARLLVAGPYHKCALPITSPGGPACCPWPSTT